ncbi:MAG: anion transporter [Cyanobacteria bacterium SW_9_44_58]|nr:MAG: anion transporter [Cyanobacteria bacterium SW_9_44_58]
MLDGLRIFIIALAYLGLALGRFPALRMNRTTIAIAGVAILVALGTLSASELWSAINGETILFLLEMMIVNVHLGYAGFFQFALQYLIKFVNSPLSLLVMLTFSSGILSMLFLNDTIAIVFTPLTLLITQQLKLNPIPYLLTVAAATNIGSVATINGNPQNLIIGSISDISYVEFALALTPVAIFGLILQILWLILLYPSARSLSPLSAPRPLRYRLHKPLLFKTLIVNFAILTGLIIGLPLAETAFVGGAVLLITRRLKPEKILREIDWDLLVLFSGLFILTEASQKLNLFAPFTYLVETSSGLVTLSTVLSNIISNVPTVLLLQTLIPQNDQQSWLLLAASSTLAGNLTLFGSMANLIVVEVASKSGHQLGIWQHLRFGFPLTGVILVFSYIWLKG